MAGTDPTERLRVELEHAREDGVAFRSAWPDAVRAALADVRGPRDRGAWKVAFSGTERAWHAAFTHAAGPADSFARELFPPDPTA